MSGETTVDLPASLWEELSHDDSDIEMEVREVSPAIADEWLDENIDNNRSVSDSKVSQYARDMRQGKWALNAQPIIFDYNGNLIDGQHRLWACKRADATFQTLVVYGVAPEAVATIDAGRPRSASDVLDMRGVTYYKHCASIARFVYRWEHGHVANRAQSTRPTRRQVIETYEKYPKRIQEWARKQGRFAGVISRPTSMAQVTFVFSLLHREKAEDFSEAIITGANLNVGDPALLLRDRLSKDRDAKEKLSYKEWMALTIKAWNYRNAGETRKVLKWDSEREDFPDIEAP